MTPVHSQDALPASTVGYDPDTPLKRTSPPAPEDQSGEAVLQENTPTLASLDPDTGDIAGGESIELTGTHLTAVEEVLFGATSATFTVDSATQITAEAPAGEEGAVDVKVVSAAGSSAGVEYTYTDEA